MRAAVRLGGVPEEEKIWVAVAAGAAGGAGGADGGVAIMVKVPERRNQVQRS